VLHSVFFHSLGIEYRGQKIDLTIIIINVFVKRHKVVTSEALGPGSVLLSRGKRESPGEEECLQPRLKHSNRVTINDSSRQ